MSTDRTSRTLLTVERRPPSGDRGWALALLPSFPLVLLVLRVWYLARQDLQTMMLVLQSASPLGLVSSLLVSLVWAIPALVLVVRALYLLLLTSGAWSRSWLARVGVRTPVWVSVPATGLAALSWQLRFLPLLLMLVLVIGRLEIRHRLRVPTATGPVWPGLLPAVWPAVWPVVSLGTVLLAGIWLAPAIGQAARHDPVTAVLLLAPLMAAPVIPGPIPPRAARWLLPGLATALALALPILVGQRYLQAPVLPRVALEFSTAQGATTIQRGSLVAVDDRFTTLLDTAGQVHFIDSGTIRGQVLCSAGAEPPISTVSVHGWQVEQSVLAWAAPTPVQVQADPRCRGAASVTP